MVLYVLKMDVMHYKINQPVIIINNVNGKVNVK